VRSLELPSGGGPWSWRKFDDEDEAQSFFQRLEDDHPPPLQLGEPHLAPDGAVIPAGSWIVFYRPIIFH